MRTCVNCNCPQPAGASVCWKCGGRMLREVGTEGKRRGSAAYHAAMIVGITVLALWVVGGRSFYYAGAMAGAPQPRVENVAIQRGQVTANSIQEVGAAAIMGNGGYLVGDLVNDSDRPLTNVSVTFNLFDAAGKPCVPMNLTIDNTAVVAPHERWRFHCPLYGAPVASWRWAGSTGFLQ